MTWEIAGEARGLRGPSIASEGKLASLSYGVKERPGAMLQIGGPGVWPLYLGLCLNSHAR